MAGLIFRSKSKTEHDSRCEEVEIPIGLGLPTATRRVMDQEGDFVSAVNT